MLQFYLIIDAKIKLQHFQRCYRTVISKLRLLSILPIGY